MKCIFTCWYVILLNFMFVFKTYGRIEFEIQDEGVVISKVNLNLDLENQSKICCIIFDEALKNNFRKYDLYVCRSSNKVSYTTNYRVEALPESKFIVYPKIISNDKEIYGKAIIYSSKNDLLEAWREFILKDKIILNQ